MLLVPVEKANGNWDLKILSSVEWLSWTNGVHIMDKFLAIRRLWLGKVADFVPNGRGRELPTQFHFWQVNQSGNETRISANFHQFLLTRISQDELLATDKVHE